MGGGSGPCASSEATILSAIPWPNKDPCKTIGFPPFTGEMSEGQRGPLQDDQAKNATYKSFAGGPAQQKARLNSRPFMKSGLMDRRYGPPSRTALPRPVPAMQSLVSLDTSYSSTLSDALSRPPETAPIVLEDDEPLRLRV